MVHHLSIMSFLKTVLFRLVVCGVLVIHGGVGCTAIQATPTFTVGQIYDVSQQTLVTLDELIPHLLSADVIFFGEEHYTPSHLEAAESILKILLAHERHPALAMEMFSWDGQPGLDRFIAERDTSLGQLQETAHWKTNWGGDFEDYQPLVTFAQSRHLKLLALNPPRTLVRLVATQGLEQALHDPQMEQWPIDSLKVDDPEYESLIFEQIEACHPGLPTDVYRRIFEASIFRDEGMARIIRDYLDRKTSSKNPLVSYTGGGHIQYQIPIPKRVHMTHPKAKLLTIYLVAWDSSKQEEVSAELQNGIADFLWLTPLGPNGVQARCG